MQKSSISNFFGIGNLKNIKVTVTVALFVAISIISGKFLAVSIGDTLRFSFENLTIILSGILFGPVVGAVTGIAADLIGCILRGYTINPILTLGAACIGFISGFMYYAITRCSVTFRVLISTFSSHLIGSVLIKTAGLSWFYSLPFNITLISRAINYSVVFAAEFFVLMILIKNKAFMGQISKIRGN